MLHRAKTLVTPLLLTGALAALAACGSSGGGSSSAGGAGGAGGAGSAGSGQKGTIGVSVPTVEGPFFTAMLYGITDEAKKAGYSVTILSAGGYGNVDKQVSQIQTLISKKVDIMLVDPADPNATEGPITQAVSAGITVVGAGDPAPGAQGYAAAGHCDVGKALAVGAKKLLPHGGDMGVLAGPAGAFWSTERLRCFKRDIAGSGIRAVAEQATDPSVATGLSTATDFLQRFPKLNLIYGADDTVGDGAAQAVQAANKCGSTQVLTAVFGEQAQQLMASGCISYDVALQPTLIGRQATQLAVGLKGGPRPAQTEVNVPTLAITPDNMRTVDTSTIRAPKGWKPTV
jgi:ABC-type sugar transport system substrate-binding protein